MLFFIVKDPTAFADELNHDLQDISEWVDQWELEFNPDPSKQATELLFSQMKYRTYHSPLIYNGNEVSKVNGRKLLGIILDTKLPYEKHINEKIIKANKKIGIIEHLSNYFALKTVDLMYKLFVRPHLDYLTETFARRNFRAQKLSRSLNFANLENSRKFMCAKK